MEPHGLAAAARRHRGGRRHRDAVAGHYQVEDFESIPVELVDIEEVSARQAVSKDAEEEPEAPPAPPRIEEAEAPKPAPQAAREVEQAAREPEPEPLPELEPLEELIEAAAAEPEPEPATRARESRSRARAGSQGEAQAAQEGRREAQAGIQCRRGAGFAQQDRRDQPGAAEAHRDGGQPRLAEFDSMSGSDERLAADLVDALRRRIESCWTLPAGARNAEELQIRLQFALNPDGMLSNYPLVLNASAHPAFDAAARSAQSAVKMCEPYNFLPIEKYDLWRDIILTFDPSRIFALN
jgi:outer membrane biosynthesis protein TonB